MDTYRARHSRLTVLLFLIGTLVAVLPRPAGAANSQTATTRAYDVTQDFTIHFNTSNCSNGIPKIQITGGFLHWTRTATSRNVSVGHIFLAQGHRTCAGGADSFSKKVSVYPAWGCGGRCSNLESESRGVSVSFGYTLREGEFNVASGSGHGHVTWSGSAKGTICNRIILHTNAVACQ